MDPSFEIYPLKNMAWA